MKKIIAIIVALILVLSFAACGKKAADSKTVKVKEDANADSITRKYIRFYPKTSLRNMCSLKNISIEIQDIFGLKP